MKKAILSLLFIPSLSYAVGNLSPVNIEGIYVREGRTDIYLKEDSNNPLNCTHANLLTILNGEYLNSDAILSAAIAAHMTGKKISGYVGACDSGMGKLSAIYIEEN
tara:strand:- start:390 stop:707 length:318 start_codon:yes stop_codon:yes gene_type:complete